MTKKKKYYSMQQDSLLTEGDVNFAGARKDWYKIIDSTTMSLLDEDAEVFLHQPLSTPCLDVLTSCEGIFVG